MRFCIFARLPGNTTEAVLVTGAPIVLHGCKGQYIKMAYSQGKAQATLGPKERGCRL
jgi:hypothetical protein